MENPFSEIELAPDNMSKRLPAILLLDTSGSMSGAPIQALNEGLKVLEEEFDPETGDSLALRSVEFALVSFGVSGVNLVDLNTGMSGVTADNAFVEAMDYRAPTLTTRGGTPMAQGMDLALSILETRKAWYRKHGIPYFRPWIFLISDGAPDGGYQGSAQAAKTAQKDGKVLVFSIGVQGANMSILQEFSDFPAIKLDGLKFRELFKFISSSVSQASSSTPGTTTTAFDVDALRSFSQIPVD